MTVRVVAEILGIYFDLTEGRAADHVDDAWRARSFRELFEALRRFELREPDPETSAALDRARVPATRAFELAGQHGDVGAIRSLVVESREAFLRIALHEDPGA